jgi:hypothetical protein
VTCVDAPPSCGGGDFIPSVWNHCWGACVHKSWCQ